MYRIKPFILAYATPANDNDALVPEFWANEALALLYENTVMLNLVRRDFEDVIQKEGDVVNVHKPPKHTATRIIDTEDASPSSVTVENVPVPLDQCWHVPFQIGSEEMSKSFKDLVALHLGPAMKAISVMIDKVLLGQYASFVCLQNAGRLGNMSSSTIATDILGVRKELNDVYCPPDSRYLILTSQAETYALENTQFTDANRVGDDGTALREASLGNKYGFGIFMCQGMASVASGDVTTTAGSLDGAEAAGQTTLSITASADETVNHWLTVAGDDTPQMVISAVDDDTITVYPGLKRAAVSGAVVTHYTQAAVNQALSTRAAGATATTDGYRAGWHGPIVYDGGPSIAEGQIITFGVTATTAALALALDKYVVVSTGTNEFTLDRPIAVAIANNGVINPGPAGEYNFAFRGDAIAFVSRPLATPPAGMGALSQVVSNDGLSVRVTLSWEGRSRGWLVIVDILSGVKVLDTDQGGVILG